jgi:hypothetical protein
LLLNPSTWSWSSNFLYLLKSKVSTLQRFSSISP